MLFNIAAVLGIRWLAAAAHAGSGSLTLWLAAAVFFFIPSALAVARLSTRFPEEGGIYVWARHEFGAWHGFLCGWCYWLSNLFYFPNLLLAGVAMGGYAAGRAEDKLGSVLAALAILWLALLTNLFGLRIGKWTHNIGGAATYTAGALIVLLGAAAWIRGGPATRLTLAPGWDFERLNFWSQIAFAFGGLELGAVLGGEVRDPRRTIPRAAWMAGLAIAAFYIAGTGALLALVTPEQISILTGLVQGAEAGAARLGLVGVTWLMTILVLAGVAGQLGAWLGGGARIPFAIGLDHYLPPAFARVHPRWGTPHLAILAQGLACTAFLLALQAGENLRIAYQLLVDMTVITYFIPFLYLFAAAWKQGLRWSPVAGLLVTLVSLAVSLVPPAGAATAWIFELKLAGGCALLIAAGRMVFTAALRRHHAR